VGPQKNIIWMHTVSMVSQIPSIPANGVLHVSDHLTFHKGPIVRLGPNEVSFASPLAALELFKTGKGFHKTEFYTVFLPDGRKDIFTEIREPLHAVKKRFAGPAYNMAAIQHNSDILEAVEHIFLAKMDDFADSGGNVACDLGTWLHYLAFDVRVKICHSPFL
jgi:hypothetical protein